MFEPPIDPPDNDPTSSGNLPRKPTQPQSTRGLALGIVTDLARRYPLPAGTDLEVHKQRIRLLADDVSDVEPGLLRLACAEAARRCTFLPTAAELLKIIQQVDNARRGVGTLTWLQQRLRQFNLANMNAGDPVRALSTKAGGVETFRVGTPGEKRKDDGQGGILVPWWSERDRDWVYPKEGVN